MKSRLAVAIIVAVILADQALKIWIKTSFPFGPVMNMGGADWARLYFIENEGMAWGWKLGGSWGKMLLTLFRLAAVIFGTWYIAKIVRENHTRGFIVCASLIYAGALGNLIDSMFYGMIFTESTFHSVATAFPEKGYAGFLHGRVVDMLYFPIVEAQWPSWVPYLGGGKFEFFSPIFNIADAAISFGVITLLLFNHRFMGHPNTDRRVVLSKKNGSQQPINAGTAHPEASPSTISSTETFTTDSRPSDTFPEENAKP